MFCYKNLVRCIGSRRGCHVPSVFRLWLVGLGLGRSQGTFRVELRPLDFPLLLSTSRKAHLTFAFFASRGSDSRGVQMMYRSLLSLTLLASASSYTLNTLRVGSQSRHAEAVMAADTMGVRDDLRSKEVRL